MLAVEAHGQRAGREAGLQLGHGILRHLARLRVELAERLLAEVAEPRDAIRIHDDVMRLDRLAWQVVLGDDHARAAPARAGKRLQVVLPRGRAAEVHAREELGELLPRALALFATDLHESLGTPRLDVQRRALVDVGAHPLDDLQEAGGVVRAPRGPLERVAVDAAEEGELLRVGPRHAEEPVGVGQLRGEVLGPPELEVGGRGLLRRDRRGVRPVEVVARRPNAERVCAGREL